MAENYSCGPTGNNVANHPEIEGGGGLTCADATERPCNEVDQNLFHVDLPAVRVVSSLSLRPMGVELQLIPGPHWRADSSQRRVRSGSHSVMGVMSAA